MADNKKSKEYTNFERLTKKLLDVPKSDLDKKVKAYEEKKKSRPSKKKGS